jgi:hypothetical protein
MKLVMASLSGRFVNRHKPFRASTSPGMRLRASGFPTASALANSVPRIASRICRGLLDKKFATILLPALLITVAFTAAAQPRKRDHNLHGWYNYFGTHSLGKSRFGMHLEGQWRRHDVLPRGQQLLLRPGINYEATDWLRLTAGYGFIRTYPYGDSPVPQSFNEHRIWQQALFRYGGNKYQWNTRVRLEQRFLGQPSREIGTPQFRFEDRIRVLQQIRKPISKATYLTGYNELWFYLPPYQASSRFDQNRAYGAFGWHVGEGWRFEAGYLQQTILQRSGAMLELNHTLVFSLLSDAPFGR